MPTAGILKVITLFLSLWQSVSSQVLTGGLGRTLPTFIVTAPKRARFDAATVFSVSASSVTQPETIQLLLRTGFASEIVLNETTLRFTADGVQTWSVVIDSDRMLQYDQGTFQLRAQHRSVVKVTEIPMNPLSGYLMIQTDKVIYTPRQTVMFRIVALDDDQRFAKWPVTVDIKNPDLIILERQHHSSQEAFIGKNFSLPRDATPGTWFITAYYEGSKVLTSETVKFDVEEYVLPTFKAEVSATEKVIALTTNWIVVNTKAMYSYGKPVHGTVELRMGVVGATSITLFNRTYQGTLGSSGVWTHNIPVADMRSHSAWFPDGSRLYLEVNVTEAGTGEKRQAVAMDTFFANPYYKIGFSGSKKYFKPGFPYTLGIDVAAANGDPASNIMVYVIVEMKSEDGDFLSGGFSSTFLLDANGRMRETFPVPAEAEAIRIQVYTLDPRAPDWSDEEFNVRKFASPTNTYIHLEKEDNNIRIRFTPPPALSIGSTELITVLILSKGRLIHSATVPRDSSGSTSLPLSPEMLTAAAPSARVVAYFYVGGMNMEIVSDSLFIETGDVCRDELHLSSSQNNSRPKDVAELTITGGGNMRVGLLAVDRAVYFLRDERSLTRQKVFTMLGQSDEGRGIGDGIDTENIFKFAGLKFLKLTEAFEATRPVVDTMLDISRLNAFLPHARRGNGLKYMEPDPNEEQIPLDQIRRFFPESWLFKEITLPANGSGVERATLPDSITTWSFTALGVGAEGGVCMSRPLDLVVFKPFFAQLRLPYKAVRLEEVTVNIGVYNDNDFDINVTVTVRGDVGLCFSEGVGGPQFFRYRTTLFAHRTSTQTLRVIPLVAGSAKLTVDVRSTNGLERDTVERTLHVVAEGRRLKKSITFPLDPSGKHSTHQSPNRRGVQRTSTATVTNRIYSKIQKQLTHIDLYMPEEVIQGSERCQISACGDLMGDIISTVLEGDNMFESSLVDAEEVIGNLAPAVHALLYLNTSQSMTPEMQATGRERIRYGVTRLLSYRKYRQGLEGSFSLTPDSQPATWLTALVLKTLCHAESITFIDHGNLIDNGFAWLLDQVRDNGTLHERDRRLAQPSMEYDLMLSAETLIALHECGASRPLSDDDLTLMAQQALLLGEHVQEMRSPLVMAKAAYALTLFAPRDEYTVQAVQRLNGMKRTNIEGLHYWSVTSENEPPQRPFWYHSGTRASSIEATAYGLLVFASQAQAQADYNDEYDYGDEEESLDWGISLDSIAGWLVQKRNSRGAFIGAMDTAAATQALAVYTLAKQGLNEVNLHCNVTTRPTRDYTHSFDFTVDNAITPKSLSNVPISRQLHVETRGTGLGQMQVRVEYNVPVETNADCRYNVTITRRTVSFYSHRSQGDEVCTYCNMGCDDDEITVNNNANNNNNNNNNRGGDRTIQTRFGRGRDLTRRRRVKRQRPRITSSRVSICIEVCLRSTEQAYSDRTIVEVQMLSGFQPYAKDLERIYAKRDLYSLSSLIWVPEKTAVEMKFNQVPHDRNTCVSFRALELEDVQRRNPAIVTVRAHEDPEPTCVTTYDPVVSEVNLAVYCAGNQTNNQGQCRCFSGQCGVCHTRTADISLNDIVNLVCDSKYVYKIRQTSRNSSDDWVDMTAAVLEIKKRDTEEVDPEIHLVTPRTCMCPHSMGLNSPHYFFGSNVDIFVDRNNGKRRTYLVDQTTTFVSPSFVHRDNADQTGDWIRLALSGQCRN